MVDRENMATRIALTCLGSKLYWRLGRSVRGLTPHRAGPSPASLRATGSVRSCGTLGVTASFGRYHSHSKAK